MKIYWRVVLLSLLFAITGCQNFDGPRFAAAMANGSAQYNQQMNQQILTQQQNFAAQNAENERLREQQQMLNAVKQSQGSSVYNSTTGTYQYVPPGWHTRIWDPAHGVWIIQP